MGTYVIAAATPVWGTYLFQPDADHILQRRTPHGQILVPFDYVTVRVEAI